MRITSANEIVKLVPDPTYERNGIEPPSAVTRSLKGVDALLARLPKPPSKKDISDLLDRLPCLQNRGSFDVSNFEKK